MNRFYIGGDQPEASANFTWFGGCVACVPRKIRGRFHFPLTASKNAFLETPQD
jgi:hypothetical protein